MKKTVRTIATYIFAVVLAAFCLFTVSAQSFLYAYADTRDAELTGLLDRTSIESDLEELDLSGISAADGLQLVYFAEVGYREGVTPQLDLLTAQSDLTAAQLEYNRAQYNCIIAAVALKMTEGTITTWNGESI